ncbi:hypothetical protein [Desulfocurvibacter africanus]|uniref:hypothetical protein n=1 Tax=Desulfocurvibacter africanus TaxID=873 RepID=UPI000485164A|nr:hypothetical protein [Desulfocurvibacter africanus]
MGLFSFLSAPLKIEEVKMVLIGKHVFNRLSDYDKRVVTLAAEDILRRCGSGKFLASLPDVSRYALISLALAEIGIDHGLNGFQWIAIKRPLLVHSYDEFVWNTARSMVLKDFAVEPEL